MCSDRGGVAPKLIDYIYPLGTVLTFTSDTDPNDIYTHQTWEKIAESRVLMGADEKHSVGMTVEAGLPNITGSARPALRSGGYPLIVDTTSGAFYKNNENGYMAASQGANTSSSYIGTWIHLNASRSSPVYGRSDTVQPAAYFVNYWKRIA